VWWFSARLSGKRGQKLFGKSNKTSYLCVVDKEIEPNKNMKRVFKVKEVIAILTAQGWRLDRQNGTSHRQFKHPTIRKTVTVDGKLSADVEVDNLKSMERQSGLRFRDFGK
jgi:predicted RNA binding protein YcfA (HicA-like mRNA interferase family)